MREHMPPANISPMPTAIAIQRAVLSVEYSVDLPMAQDSTWLTQKRGCKYMVTYLMIFQMELRCLVSLALVKMR